MPIQKAFKYALLPTAGQAAFFRRTTGACRFIWNRALAEQQRRHGAGEKRLNYAALCRELTRWRADEETGWLWELSCHVGQQALKDLERGFTNLFEKRAAPPRFRRRCHSESFRCCLPHFEVDAINGRVRLPKLGWVRYRQHRQPHGVPRNITITQRAGRWYVSIQVELEVPEPQHAAPGLAVGLGVGVRVATLSTGEQFAPPAHFERHEERLAWAQRKLARKRKGSNNWNDQKLRVQRLHAAVADVRSDALHKASDSLTERFAFIAVEDHSFRSLKRNGNATAAQPGSGELLFNHSFGEFRRQLEYKARWRGGTIVVVDPRPISPTCPRCSHVSAEDRFTQADFACDECGFSGQADVVAAKNVLTRARSARSACSPAATSPVSAEAPASKSRHGSVGRNHRGRRDAAKSKDGDRSDTESHGWSHQGFPNRDPDDPHRLALARRRT